MGSSLIPPGQPLPMQPGEYTPPAQPNQATFRTTNLDLPSAIYIQRDDVVTLVSFSVSTAEVFTVTFRLLRPDGVIVVISKDIAYTTTNVGAQFDQIQLTEGFLLSAAVISQTVVSRGGSFARLVVQRGAKGQPLIGTGQVLCADAVTKNAPAAWPQGRILSQYEVTGNYNTNIATNPGAGADFTVTVPLGLQWKMTGFSCVLTTSATVANRQVSFKLNQGALVVSHTAAIPASTVANFTVASGLVNAVGADGRIQVPLPTPAILPSNSSFVSITTNIQAGDQWSAIVSLFEQFMVN